MYYNINIMTDTPDLTASLSGGGPEIEIDDSVTLPLYFEQNTWIMILVILIILGGIYFLKNRDLLY